MIVDIIFVVVYSQLITRLVYLGIIIKRFFSLYSYTVILVFPGICLIDIGKFSVLVEHSLRLAVDHPRFKPVVRIIFILRSLRSLGLVCNGINYLYACFILIFLNIEIFFLGKVLEYYSV